MIVIHENPIPSRALLAQYEPSLENEQLCPVLDQMDQEEKRMIESEQIEIIDFTSPQNYSLQWGAALIAICLALGYVGLSLPLLGYCAYSVSGMHSLDKRLIVAKQIHNKRVLRLREKIQQLNILLNLNRDEREKIQINRAKDHFLSSQTRYCEQDPIEYRINHQLPLGKDIDQIADRHFEIYSSSS